MNLKFILIAVIFFTAFTSCNIGDASDREKKLIKATIAAYHYEKISGDLTYYKTVEVDTRNNFHGEGDKSYDVENYTFAVTLSDSVISFDSLKKQSDVIASKIFNDVMLRDTSKYYFTIVQLCERARDTVLSFPYRPKDF